MIGWKSVLGACFGMMALTTPLYSQTPQVVAVRPGRLFDSKSGQLLTRQVVLIQGDRISEVGSEDQVKIPPGADQMGHPSGQPLSLLGHQAEIEDSDRRVSTLRPDRQHRIA